MSSLKWLGIWGMVNYSKPKLVDVNNWSLGMDRVLGDERARHYYDEFVRAENIPPLRGECTHFQNFTIRPITCNFK